MSNGGVNVVLALCVPLPSILFYYALLNPDYPYHSFQNYPLARRIWDFCTSSHPLLLLNILFFINVNITFWIISLFQKNTWLIDLYWTVIPVMMGHYFATHPHCHTNPWRSRAVLILTWLWSVRLTHSYFRREGWQWGEREDWRFAQLRNQYGNHWWWISFFAVYVSQQIFLVGICLPMYAVHNSGKPWNSWDVLAVFVCILGIIVAYFADTQLYNFVKKNKILKELNVPSEPVLDKGLWRYSRHPNYFGEQLWWWGLVIFACSAGQSWTFVGSAVNSCCLAYVTVLVENKMVADKSRAKEYEQYQRRTSVWIPWFKTKEASKKDAKRQ